MRLRHIGQEPRALADRSRRKRAPAKAHLAGARRQQAKQRLEQRCLAAAIGPEQRQNFAFGQSDVEPLPDQPVAVADGKGAAFESHDQVRCTSARSQMKNGVPMNAVKMPSGISMLAAVRAMVSISNK